MPTGAGEGAVEVDLPGGEGGGRPRTGAELDFGGPGQARRTPLRPILEFEIVDRGPGGGRLDLGGRLPRRVEGGGAVRQRGADDARNGYGALEARRIFLDPYGAFGIDGHGRRGRIDEQAHLHAAVVAAAASAQAKRIGPVMDGEAALP